jgi:hypothetical protein
LVWVLLTRVIYMALFLPYGARVRLLNLPLLLYDQWFGSLLKFKAFMFPHEQSWSKGGAREHSTHSLSRLRRFVVRYRFGVAAACFLQLALLMSGATQLPQPRRLRSLQATDISDTAKGVAAWVVPSGDSRTTPGGDNAWDQSLGERHSVASEP